MLAGVPRELGAWIECGCCVIEYCNPAKLRLFLGTEALLCEDVQSPSLRMVCVMQSCDLLLYMAHAKLKQDDDG